jgi:penicillin amidase
MTLDQIEATFMDTHSLQAEETLARFRPIDLENAYEAWLERTESWKKEEKPPEGRKLRKKEKKEAEDRDFLAEARAVLDDWDRTVETESAGAAAFAFLWKRLLEETFSDQVPSYFWPTGTGELENAIYHLLQQPANPWWDDRRTPEVREERDDILTRALVAGLLDARKELGDRPKKWEWGKVHQVEFRNASLGESGIGIIERIFNRGPYPIRGGNSQVHKTNWSLREPFEANTIPSQRAIYDPADPSRSLFMNTVGQSGHPFHRHYDDFIEPYLRGEFHPSRWTREEAEGAAGGRRLTLRPAS